MRRSPPPPPTTRSSQSILHITARYRAFWLPARARASRARAVRGYRARRVRVGARSRAPRPRQQRGSSICWRSTVRPVSYCSAPRCARRRLRSVRQNAAQLARESLQHARRHEQQLRRVVPLLQLERFLCVTHPNPADGPLMERIDPIPEELQHPSADGAQCVRSQTTMPTTMARHTTTMDRDSQPTPLQAAT